jgi:hypothetical protein
MDDTMDYSVDPYWLPIAIAILAVLLVVAVAVALWSRSRKHGTRQHLRSEFGPEYDRAVAEFGSVQRAEKELLARKRRVGHFRIHALQPADHDRFAASWGEVQRMFVDSPVAAVDRAHELVKQLMAARGYPIVDFDQRVKDLSVDHPRVVQHYRAARELYTANHGREWNTEELRQAMVHYRALFADLLERPPHAPPMGHGMEVPA